MPPSTVFSYWRRDHRRTSPAPGSASPIGRAYSPTTSADAPPRLPGLPATSTFSGTLIESPQGYVDPSPPPLPSEKQQRHLQEIIVEDKRLSAALSSQHSYNNLRVPIAPTDNLVRPHSSPAQHEESSPESIQPSQPLPLNGQPDIHSQKPNGSWRLGFNRNGPNSPAEDQRDTRSNKEVGKDLRINTNVEGGVGFIGGVSLKEMRTTESVPSAGHREQQEPATQQQQQQQQHKHGKTKRHLLNPMTLLARRRSSQMSSSRLDEGSLGYANFVPAIPDDYDPRIRGNIVHDFSAPRPRPQLSGRDSSIESYKKSSVPSSAVTRHSEHSPVFKEHFEEDRKPLQVENKGFLQSSLLFTDTGSTDHDPAELPEFARKLPSSLPELGDNQPTVEHNYTVPEAPLPTSSIQPTPRSSPKKSIESTSQPASSIPIRLKSDASRFSFDMNGVGSSAQEKLLEQNYKEKEAARRQEARQNRSSLSDYDDDDFDYDAMEDDGGFEERIPGINADADDMDDQFQDFSGVVKTSELSFVPILPTIAASPISPSYPESAMGGAVGNAHANAMNGMVGTTAVPFNPSRSSSTYSRCENVQNGNDDLSRPVAQFATEQIALHASSGTSIDEIKLQLDASINENEAHDDDDDDMYYDDGEFGELPENEDNGTFDESIFDNDNGQLYERKFYPGTKIPVQLQEEQEEEKEDDPVQRLESKPSTESQIKHVPSLASEFRPDSWDFGNQVASKLSSSEIPKVSGGVLSEHNLEAFHSALARVADEAAAAGNLQRNASLSETSLGQGSNSQLTESHPGLISDDNGSSQATGFEAVLDDFNYDDDGFDDDLIIAEANADALENDDEGFYGQEFGFYAQSSENSNDERIYGGYFGTQGPGSLNRSHSGGANFREPSLTPITERSEWSTRNSIISLTTLGPAAVQPNPMANPGLSQLVDMEYDDEDMSLGALMKLRRGAFGGSNGSLRSSAGSLSPQPGPVGASNRASFLSIPEDSPVELNPNNNTELAFQLPEPSRRLSYNQSSSPLSERNSLPGSLTLTVDGLSNGETRSDGDSAKNPRPSHSRASSSPSIGYKQQEGSSKWALERRSRGDGRDMEVY